MAQNITFQRSGDAAGWIAAWMVLGSARISNLFPQLGVPSAMANRPARLMEIAQEAWEQVQQGLPGMPAHFVHPDVLQAYQQKVAAMPDNPPRLEEFLREALEQIRQGLPGAPVSLVDPEADAKYYQVWREFLRAEWQKITDAYDEDVATELYAWLQRHFLDADQEQNWSNWLTLWLWLSNDRPLQVAFPFGIEVFDHLRTLTEAFNVAGAYEFGYWRNHVQELLAQQATDFEQRAFLFEDGSPRDMVAWVLNILREEQAREIWQRLAATLTAAEQEALLEWRDKELAKG